MRLFANLSSKSLMLISALMCKGMGGGESGPDMLKQYGTNLTELASQGKLDPVIGRESEIRRTLQMYVPPILALAHIFVN